MTLAVLLAAGVQLGDPRHRGRRLLHAGAARSTQQAAFVGVRSTFYRVGDDRRPGRAGLPRRARSARLTGNVTLRLVARVRACWRRCSCSLCVYHRFVLPRPAGRPRRWRATAGLAARILRGPSRRSSASPASASILAFLLLFRFARVAGAEAGDAVPARSAARSGGLGLTTAAGRHRLRHRRRDRAARSAGCSAATRSRASACKRWLWPMVARDAPAEPRRSSTWPTRSRTNLDGRSPPRSRSSSSATASVSPRTCST